MDLARWSVPGSHAPPDAPPQPHGAPGRPRCPMLRLVGIAMGLLLRLLGARRRVLAIGRSRVVYYVVGPPGGEPWLLLHGMGSFAGSWWPVVKALKGECRLVVPE